MIDARDELTTAFERFRAEPFPRDGCTDRLSELHAELVDYDGYVAGLVTRLIAGNPLDQFRLQYDDDLELRITEAGRESAAAARDAARYISRMHETRDLILLGERVLAGPDSS